MIYEYTKSAYLDQLETEIKAVPALASTYVRCSALGTQLSIEFSAALDSGDEAALSSIVTNHAGATSVQQLSVYLDVTIFPFITNLIRTFAAENIAMGITQAGKTGHVLALFSKYYPVPNATYQNSLKNSFDTGSLYVSRDIIQYIRDNPTEYDGLSPFITDARLLTMKNKIETVLGIPLSS